MEKNSSIQLVQTLLKNIKNGSITVDSIKAIPIITDFGDGSRYVKYQTTIIFDSLEFKIKEKK